VSSALKMSAHWRAADVTSPSPGFLGFKGLDPLKRVVHVRVGTCFLIQNGAHGGRGVGSHRRWCFCLYVFSI
jgi:hypothetical protein